MKPSPIGISVERTHAADGIIAYVFVPIKRLKNFKWAPNQTNRNPNLPQIRNTKNVGQKQIPVRTKKRDKTGSLHKPTKIMAWGHILLPRCQQIAHTLQGRDTFPTTGKGKLSSKLPFDGICSFPGGYNCVTTIMKTENIINLHLPSPNTDALFGQNSVFCVKNDETNAIEAAWNGEDLHP